MAERTNERQQLEEAIERIATGSAICSSGQFTVVALADEAQMPRTRIYEQYPDLIASFRTRIGQQPTPPALQAVKTALHIAQTTNSELAAENRQLRERIRTLSALVAELALQVESTTVVQMHRPGPRDSNRH